MSKNLQRVFIWVIALVMLVGTLGAYVAVIVSNNNNAQLADETAKAQQQLQEQAEQCQPVKTKEGSVYQKPEPVKFDQGSVNELKTEDVKVGDGKAVTSTGDCLTVHYLGNTADGTVFDNSYDRNEPTAFPLGGVIQGWQEGLIGMKVGGIRKIFIPADKAYGAQGNGREIGPNAPLFFYVELINVE